MSLEFKQFDTIDNIVLFIFSFFAMANTWYRHAVPGECEWGKPALSRDGISVDGETKVEVVQSRPDSEGRVVSGLLWTFGMSS
ncbi:hypothetical protein ElyMa_006509100 [Elysia marginata]|uniref:Reelin domain-containing protein n=1 Tax=Elysia marginata TaxID=1093978 RepID=A0AAV4I7G9_9GAST|nr:hypothetical protein ElyMa_006509100 [Elysia marginata]